MLLNTVKPSYFFPLIALNLKKESLTMAGDWNKMIFKVPFCDSVIPNPSLREGE